MQTKTVVVADSADLAQDLLRGVKAIAAFIGERPRRTFYLLEKGLIPGTKIGGAWYSRRSALRKRFSVVLAEAS